MFASTVSARGRCRASRPPVCVARAAPPASAPANAVELEDLVDIIKAVDSSDVVEMELTGKKFSMTVKKQEALQPAEPTYVQAPVAMAAAPAAPAPPPPAAPKAAAPKAAAAPAPVAPAVSGVEVSAPMSGTVYRRPAPGEPLFVKEGDKVAKGQSICIIEAMKLMNEIEAEVSGTVVKWVAEDAGTIDPGDVICIIDPKA